MKNENTLKSIESSLKKIQERSSSKRLIFAIIGISALLVATVFAIMQLKKKFDEEDSELDEMDEDIFDDDDDIREDYYALDYEDEE